MRIKAQLVQKYPVRSGISQATGNEWKRQEMKFTLLRDDWSPTTETMLVSCNSALVIDAFEKVPYEAGAKGIISIWCQARDYTRRDGTTSVIQDISMNNWEPQSEAVKVAAEHVNEQPAQTAQPAPTAPAPTAPVKNETIITGHSDLPF